MDVICSPSKAKPEQLEVDELDQADDVSLQGIKKIFSSQLQSLVEEVQAVQKYCKAIQREQEDLAKLRDKIGTDLKNQHAQLCDKQTEVMRALFDSFFDRVQSHISSHSGRHSQRIGRGNRSDRTDSMGMSPRVVTHDGYFDEQSRFDKNHKTEDTAQLVVHAEHVGQRRQARTTENMMGDMKRSVVTSTGNALRKSPAGGANPKLSAGEEAAEEAIYSKHWGIELCKVETDVNKREDEDEKNKNLLQKCVSNSYFNGVCLVAVITNTLFIAIQAQWAASNIAENTVPPIIFTIDLCFCCFFTTELCLRLIAERSRFFRGSHRNWNIFDVLIVVISVQDQVLSLLSMASGADGVNLTFLRIIRVMRVLRMIRVFKFCPQLIVMINGILESLQCMVWLFALLGFLLFMVGLALMIATTNYLQGEVDAVYTELGANLQYWFGSVDRSLLCLFKAVSGGMEWQNVGDALLEVAVPYGVMFVAFVAFVLFGVANVVTSVFVESARRNGRKAEIDQKTAEVDDVRKLLKELDVNRTGFISKDDFAKYLEDVPALLGFFQTMEMSAAEARHYFNLLDMFDEQKVEISFMTRNVLRLVGEARNSELSFLLYEHRRLARDFRGFCAFVEQHFKDLGRQLGDVTGFLKDPDVAAALEEVSFLQMEPE